jgi:hypothetical protein
MAILLSTGSKKENSIAVVKRLGRFLVHAQHIKLLIVACIHIQLHDFSGGKACLASSNGGIGALRRRVDQRWIEPHHGGQRRGTGGAIIGATRAWDITVYLQLIKWANFTNFFWHIIVLKICAAQEKSLQLGAATQLDRDSSSNITVVPEG